MPKAKRKKKKAVHKSALRRWHSLAGLAASVFLVVLSVTGIYLNHEHDWFRTKGSPIETQLLRVVETGPYATWLGSNQGVFRKEEGGHFQKVRLPYALRDITAIEIDVSKIWVASRSGVVFVGDLSGSYSWQRVPMPEGIGELHSLSVEGSQLTVLGSMAIWGSVDSGQTWTQLLVKKQGLSSWMRQLHSGMILSPILVYLHDLSALILLGLILSGLVIYLRLFKPSKKGPK